MDKRLLICSTVAFVGFLLFVMLVYSTLIAVNISNTTGIIANGAISINPSSISWGVIDFDSPVSKAVNVTNAGNVPLTLTMETMNVVPATLNFTLTWDYSGVLDVGAYKTTAFTLTVFGGLARGDAFSFDIVITGVG